MSPTPFQTMLPRPEVDVFAPDGSEIRLLCEVMGGSMVTCTLPVGGCSAAVTHRTVEELWCFIEGTGEVWRRQGEREEVTPVYPGVGLSIPLGTHFQFRCTSDTPLRFIIVTMPPWPGPDEAVRVADHWPVG